MSRGVGGAGSGKKETDPAEPATLDRLARWYDFLVEHHDVLLDPDIVDVTGSYAGLYNDDLDVTYPGAPTSGTARPGAVWRRITRRGDWLVGHLIKLRATPDDGWDHPQPPPRALSLIQTSQPPQPYQIT